MQVFGFQPAGQFGEADQIGEQHRDLAMLRRRRLPRRFALLQFGYGLQQLLAVTERGDAEFAQIVGGQRRERCFVDVIGGEGRGVLAQPQPLQPSRDVHGPASVDTTSLHDGVRPDHRRRPPRNERPAIAVSA